MAEHSARYERFAQALTAVGYAVYASDHRGHGGTAADADVGYFGDTDGWDTVVADLAEVGAHARAEYPDIPVALFGHSMGSTLARAYVTRYPDDVDALVLSGTAGDPGVAGKVGLGIARLEARIRGRRHVSTLMNSLVFGRFNAPFKPARTDFDWLSRDPAEVDKYVADPRCGAVFTSGFYCDMLGGLAAVSRDEVVRRTPHDLPVLLISGEMDPVGGKGGRGVKGVAAQLRRAGVRDVTLKIYPGARHELLNETSRDEVTTDVIDWLQRHGLA
ncbi:Lysophospholipase, alpha-beta hydrolase superfamily [Raineyella antarctica]|uniref:Lysophospholipase, alpha-beta hydrolase superfamily n=2 Tax=Raineyella antarctica TaxID=1577474 RepID=A0A1G6GPN0_9ACTN|nr:Lysophospholipase, alpha-beta hydrolase superfamily [Raineyella antarctica]